MSPPNQSPNIFSTPRAAGQIGGMENMDKSVQIFRARYGFFFLGYRSQYAWWEAVALGRKVVLTAIAVTFWNDTRSQIEFGMLLMVFALVAHALLQPYATRHLNWYDT